MYTKKDNGIDINLLKSEAQLSKNCQLELSLVIVFAAIVNR